MKKSFNEVQTVPTANIAVNKSRIKIYNKTGDMPTYYLQSGQEFQIELFNPTTDVILAKISLNNQLISQGGLVLNPGQRIFLDRYLDVAKKFKFDTYEVSNTKEVKKAIENNGDVKIQFYREKKPQYFGGLHQQSRIMGGSFGGPVWINNTASGYAPLTYTNTSLNNNTSFSDNIVNTTLCSSSVTMDSFTLGEVSVSSTPIKQEKSLKSKTIETGRVEEGSQSNQKFKTVDKDFEYFAFHTVEYKLLPVSQKINTTEDLNVKIYCTNCGTKLGKGHNFCSNCGTKA